MLLVINFGDNDFYCALSKLASHILEEVKEDAIITMDKDGSLNERLSEMFRCMCVLHQTRWDMYPTWGTPEDESKEAIRYLTGDYYKITNAKIVDDYSTYWNNSETLIVDLSNNQWNIV